MSDWSEYAALADQYDAAAEKLNDCIARRNALKKTLTGQAYATVVAEIQELYRMRSEAHDTAGQLRKLARPIQPLRTVLVTTSTCPNCASAAGRLASAGVEFERVVADLEPEIAVLYNVMTVPTLLRIWEGRHEAVTGLSDIIKFIEEREEARHVRTS